MNEDKLESLFDLLVEDFARLLRDKSLNSADRKTLIEFLNENNVKVNGQAHKGIKNILSDLPFSEEESNVTKLKH